MGRKPAAVQPNPKVFSRGDDQPQALERTQHVTNQVWSNEQTLIYGEADDLPLRILDAVNKSPVATSCLGQVETFITGQKFSDEGLMNHPIDEEGNTLWSLHCELSKYMALLEGFSTRFTFNGAGEITNVYSMNLESLRFVAPNNQQSSKINKIKYNPYFGTAEYKNEFTKEYYLWDKSQIANQIALEGHSYRGQVYYHGSLRPPYKFYPRPKYWSADKWIYIDQAIQTFHKSNTDNGFFLSSLITMVGDPNALSKNPKYFSTVEKNGQKYRENTKGVTVGQEVEESLGEMFSGAKKAGKAWLQWVKNIADAPNLQSFPSNTTFDVFAGTFLDCIRGITIATEVPAILANLPQQASSLGSDGNSMQKAVELMHARVAKRQNTLENFYNNILLPNLVKKPSQKVNIVNYSPINVPAELPDKIWEWLNDQEKEEFVKENYPSINVVPRGTQPTQTTMTPTTTPDQGGEAVKVNEAIKSLKMSEINRLMGVVGKFSKGKLSYDQAKQILTSYGLDDEQIKAWLTNEEDEIAA